MSGKSWGLKLHVRKLIYQSARISCGRVLLISSFENTQWRKVKRKLIDQICECALIAFLVEASC